MRVSDLSVFDRIKTKDDFDREEELFRLKKMAALKAKQGNLPAAIQIANEIQKRRAAGDEQGATLLENSAKIYDKGVQYDPNTGQYIDMSGYAGALGNLKYGENYGGESATQQVKNAYEPARAEDIARREAGVKIETAPIIAGGEEGAKLNQQLQYEPLIEAQKVSEKSRAESEFGLPKVIEQGKTALNTLDQLIDENGNLRPGVGSISGGFLGMQGRQSAMLPLGKNQRKFQPYVDQIKGQSFLSAYERLKGGGVITEIEGQKATDAIVRLNQAQSDEDFALALKDLRDIIQIGLQRAAYQAGNPETYDPIAASQAAIQQRQSEIGANPYQRQELAPPKPGDVVGDYMYNGGDPSKQSSWKKVR